MNTRLVLALLLAVLAVGCSGHSSAPMQPAAALPGVTPADGATAVRLDAALNLEFGTVVDRSTVEGGVHLIAETDMFSTCPDSSMGNHGTMETVMNDPNMLHHMDVSHATRGSFAWNPDGTICTFQPDSLMRPQTRYMVHISAAMLDMMGGSGGTMMGGRMNGAGDMMMHFQTMGSDGQAEHHP